MLTTIQRIARGGGRRFTRTTIVGGCLVLLLAVIEFGGLGARYLMVDHRYVVADNARIDGDQVQIVAPTSGVVRGWRLDVGTPVRSKQFVGRVEIQGSGARAQRPIRSPGTGTVVHSSVTDGVYVDAGSLLATAYNDGGVYVTARVPEEEIGDVRPGAPVDVIVDAAPDAPVTGLVSRIGGASAGVSELDGSPGADPTSQDMPIYPGSNTDPQNPQRVDQYIPVRILFTTTGSAPIAPGENVTVHIRRPS